MLQQGVLAIHCRHIQLRCPWRTELHSIWHLILILHLGEVIIHLHVPYCLFILARIVGRRGLCRCPLHGSVCPRCGLPLRVFQSSCGVRCDGGFWIGRRFVGPLPVHVFQLLMVILFIVFQQVVQRGQLQATTGEVAHEVCFEFWLVGG